MWTKAHVRHAIILADYDFKSDAFILKDSERAQTESHNVEDEYIIKKPLTQKVKLRIGLLIHSFFRFLFRFWLSLFSSDSLFYYEPHEGFYISFTAEGERMKRHFYSDSQMVSEN